MKGIIMDFLYTLQNLRNPVLDAVMTFFTYFGDEILVIGILCATYWCINKKLAYKVCFTYFISGLMVQGLKIVFRIERPWIRDSRLIPSDSALDGATGYSFPSGHTQGSTGLFSVLAYHFKKAWGYIVFFLIIALVMLSRMYLGYHTPWDVLVAFGITFTVSLIVNYIFENFTSTSATRVIVLILTELISAALIGITYYVVLTGKSTEELAMDCFKAAGAGLAFGIAWFIEDKYIRFSPQSVSSVGGQILKFIVGIGVTLGLKQGLKALGFALFPDSAIIINIVRYFIVVIWIVAIYPLIIKKITSHR